MTDLASDWQTTHARSESPVDTVRSRGAARRIAEFTRELPAFRLPLVEIDATRLRANVYALVSPGLVRRT